MVAVIGVLAFAASSSAVSAEHWMDTVYADFQRLLDTHLHEHMPPEGGLTSAFDYQAALADAQTPALLAQQDRALARFDITRLSSREEAIAFWINAYNYFMIAHILAHTRNGEPVSSVRDFGHLLNPFRVFRRDLFDVGGERYSLDTIEKSILLGQSYRACDWKDARVHFAVNCASVGCPPLRAEIYRPANVDRLLDENTRLALQTHRHLHITGETLFLTSLFNWYERDYIEAAGSVQAFIEAHAEPSLLEAIARTRRVTFISYDWRLNSPENFPEFAGR
jgi:hypothetical protein